MQGSCPGGWEDAILVWIESASLSGISMLNSCAIVRDGQSFSAMEWFFAYLLDGHDDLDGVKAVETEIVREVGGGLDLLGLSITPYIPSISKSFRYQLTFAGSLT